MRPQSFQRLKGQSEVRVSAFRVQHAWHSDACAGKVFYPSGANLIGYLPISLFLAEDLASSGDL